MGGIHLVKEKGIGQLLMQVYPEYSWKTEKFPVEVGIRQSFEMAGKELGIKEISDWYKVTTKVYKKSAGKKLIV